MAKTSNSNSQLPSSIQTSIHHTAKPSSEFYSIFSEEELLEIIQALEIKREIPLKYSYKGRGAKIWDNFYLKYIVPKWYRTSNIEIDLLKDNFEYINDSLKSFEKINIIDIGSGNSYPAKEFISKLNKLGKVNQYVALDISEELLALSQKNFIKWFPSIEFASSPIDIENSCIPKILFENKAKFETEDIAKVILHLGVTIGNHQNRTRVLKNFRDSMGENDLLVFTNETGSNSKWDGRARGAFKYHAEQIYAWIKNKMGIRAEDCELVRKYDLETDSIVANMKFLQNYTICFSFMGLDKNIEISEGEEITIWRHHKYEMPELLQEIEQAGLKLVHYNTNKYLTHIMAICKVASN
jgi:uncharacterized SAM-dependent methyltransferase